jgi:hypothetical protein
LGPRRCERSRHADIGDARARECERGAAALAQLHAAETVEVPVACTLQRQERALVGRVRRDLDHDEVEPVPRKMRRIEPAIRGQFHE